MYVLLEGGQPIAYTVRTEGGRGVTKGQKSAYVIKVCSLVPNDVFGMKVPIYSLAPHFSSEIKIRPVPYLVFAV